MCFRSCLDCMGISTTVRRPSPSASDTAAGDTKDRKTDRKNDDSKPPPGGRKPIWGGWARAIALGRPIPVGGDTKKDADWEAHQAKKAEAVLKTAEGCSRQVKKETKDQTSYTSDDNSFGSSSDDYSSFSMGKESRDSDSESIRLDRGDIRPQRFILFRNTDKPEMDLGEERTSKFLKEVRQYDKSSPQDPDANMAHALFICDIQGSFAIDPFIIGTGCSSIVKSGTFLSSTTDVSQEGEVRKDIAIKIVNPEGLRFAPSDSFVKQAHVIVRLKHRHVMPIYSIFKYRGKVFIVSDLAEIGDVTSFVRNNGPLSEKLSRVWFKQICEGLEYCHAQGVAHGNLKCRNILIGADMNVKLSDVGLCRFYGHSSEVIRCENLYYDAPESRKLKGDFDLMKADMWSLGVCLFYMWNCQYPYTRCEMGRVTSPTEKIGHVLYSNLSAEMSAECSYLKCPVFIRKPTPMIYYFVHELLKLDAGKRITLKEILADSWLAFTADKLLSPRDEELIPADA